MQELTRRTRSGISDRARDAFRFLTVLVDCDMPERLVELERELAGKRLLPLAVGEELVELRNGFEGWGRWFVEPGSDGEHALLRDLRGVLEQPPVGSPEASVEIVHVSCGLTELEWYLFAHHVGDQLRVTRARVKEEFTVQRVSVVVDDLTAKVEDLASEEDYLRLQAEYVEELGFPGNHYEMEFACSSRAEILARLALVESGIREQINYPPDVIFATEDVAARRRDYRCTCGATWSEPVEKARPVEADCEACGSTLPVSGSVRVRTFAP